MSRRSRSTQFCVEQPMAPSSICQHVCVVRLVLCLTLLVLPAIGCGSGRDPVQITQSQCWAKLLGPNPQLGPTAMTRDGKKLAATFHRDPGSRYLDRVLRVFDLDSYGYETFSLDKLAPWAPGEVESLEWLDNGSSLYIFIHGDQRRLVRFDITRKVVSEIASCLNCASIAISMQGQIARVDRYGDVGNFGFGITVGGLKMSTFPPSLAEYQPRSVTWSPNGSYLAAVFEPESGKPEILGSRTAVFFVGSGPPTMVGAREQDGDSVAYWPDDEGIVLTASKERVIRLYQVRPAAENVLLGINRIPAIAEEIGNNRIFYANVSSDRSKVAFVSFVKVGELQIFVVDLRCMSRP